MWWKCEKCGDEIVVPEEVRANLRNGGIYPVKCKCGALDFNVSLKMEKGLWKTITEGTKLPSETIKPLND